MAFLSSFTACGRGYVLTNGLKAPRQRATNRPSRFMIHGKRPKQTGIVSLSGRLRRERAMNAPKHLSQLRRQNLLRREPKNTPLALPLQLPKPGSR